MDQTAILMYCTLWPNTSLTTACLKVQIIWNVQVVPDILLGLLKPNEGAATFEMLGAI
jgi:hypothetical protein